MAMLRKLTKPKTKQEQNIEIAKRAQHHVEENILCFHAPSTESEITKVEEGNYRISQEAALKLQVSHFLSFGQKNKLKSMWAIPFNHHKYQVNFLNDEHPFNQGSIFIIDPTDEAFEHRTGEIFFPFAIKLTGWKWEDVWKCCDLLLRNINTKNCFNIQEKCISDIDHIHANVYAVRCKKPKWLIPSSPGDMDY